MRSLASCHVTLVASFHDVCDPAPLKIDSRPSNLEDAGGGWAVTPWYSASTLQVCTSRSAKRVTQGPPFVFRADVTDGAGRTAAAELTATPTCSPGDNDCICQCHPDFDPSGSCPPWPDPEPPC